MKPVPNGDGDSPAARKIVHVDMDAFYASVEQRDDARLRGRPVVVAWKGPRSVVCAASYEARKFGVHSAMPALRAARLCPEAAFVAPDFERYKAVSRQVRAIFARHTALIEPLSLDEAYLDVSRNLQNLASATAVAQTIRDAIRAELQLTASAGVAPNKFLAKIASDWRKPDGQFVIPPQQVWDFLTELPVKKLPGVGAVTEKRLHALDISAVGDLRQHSLEALQQQFGRMGKRLFELARGIDRSEVSPDRQRQSVSSEDTFAEDQPLAALEPAIRRMAEATWHSAEKLGWRGRTIVLKLKTSDFRILTRSETLAQPPADFDTLLQTALRLWARVDASEHARYRLVGVGMSRAAAKPAARSTGTSQGRLL